MSSLMVSGTPFETYEVDGIPVYVKREDLCSPDPSVCPPYSKMRGLELFLNKQDRNTPIGVQDAGFHSRSGWGTAYFCRELGMECYVGYPVFKREGTIENHTIRPYQLKAKELGANLIPVKAGRATVAYYQARNIMSELTQGRGLMLPAGLKLKESSIGTAKEVMDHTPDELKAGTWIVSISSGTVASGVLRGLRDYHDNISFVAHLGSHKNRDKTHAYMVEMAGYEPDDFLIVDEGYDYSDEVTDPCPFPASKFYENKAWQWMKQRIHWFEQPIVFWNIGD